MDSKERIACAASMFRNKLAGINKSILNSRFHPADEKAMLFDSIEKAYSELEQAQYTFNQLSDSAAVDYASYSILAAEARYTYLLNIAKQKEIHL